MKSSDTCANLGPRIRGGFQVGADVNDNAREVGTYNSLILHSEGVGYVELVDRVERHGVHANKNLAWSGLWSGELAEGDFPRRWS